MKKDRPKPVPRVCRGLGPLATRYQTMFTFSACIPFLPRVAS
jgi:hypothetical protein